MTLTVTATTQYVSSLHSSLDFLFHPSSHPGQQEDEEDPGGGAASEKGAGEGCQESSEEHE